MTKEEALNILEQAINAGNTKGVYSLADIRLIINALDTIKTN
jgi:hypothetical protein